MVASRVYHGEYTLQDTVILTQLNLNMQARDLERMPYLSRGEEEALRSVATSHHLITSHLGGVHTPSRTCFHPQLKNHSGGAEGDLEAAHLGGAVLSRARQNGDHSDHRSRKVLIFD